MCVTESALRFSAKIFSSFLPLENYINNLSFFDYDKDCNLEFEIFINIRMGQQRQQKESPNQGAADQCLLKGSHESVTMKNLVQYNDPT